MTFVPATLNAQGVHNVLFTQLNPSLDFQQSIKEGNTASVLNQILQGSGVSQPLPNGEMPLHFAVRNNQPEVVSILLQQGANPETKDFQNLTAIDHAVLMRNDSMLAAILGNKIGKDLKEINEQIKCKGSASHVATLNSQIQKIGTVDEKKLSAVNLAAYLGSDYWIDNQLSPSAVNDLDANGLAPIHYAILGNRYATVEKLIQLGSNVHMINRDGNSLLHFAAMSGSKQILDKLVSLGVDLNHKNTLGQTALHYAAAKENLNVVETLVKGGANPYLLDAQGMSALSLIGISAHQRDPLSLPKTHLLLFTTTTLYWLSTLAVTGGWVTSQEANIATLGIMVATAVIANWSEFGILLTNLNSKWKKVIAWVLFCGLASIPPFSVAFQTWNTYHVARSAFEGLKKSWHNVGYRNWAVAKNVIVYSVNTAASAKKMYARCAEAYEIYLNATFLVRMFVALQNNDQDAYFEAYTDYLRFLKDRYNIGEETADFSQSAKIDPSTLVGLSTIERLRKPELNPQCPEHALMMMSPTFTMDQLRSQGTSLYKKAFREMMLRDVHPDKAGSSEEIKEAAVRLNAASDTLKKWVEKNNK